MDFSPLHLPTLGEISTDISDWVSRIQYPPNCTRVKHNTPHMEAPKPSPIDKPQTDKKKRVAPPISSQSEPTKKLRKSLECTFCGDIWLDPITIKCGHTFCKLCLCKLGDSANRSCPFCRAALPNNICHFSTNVVFKEMTQNFPQDLEKKELYVLQDSVFYTNLVAEAFKLSGEEKLFKMEDLLKAVKKLYDGPANEEARKTHPRPGVGTVGYFLEMMVKQGKLMVTRGTPFYFYLTPTTIPHATQVVKAFEQLGLDNSNFEFRSRLVCDLNYLAAHVFATFPPGSTTELGRAFKKCADTLHPTHSYSKIFGRR